MGDEQPLVVGSGGDNGGFTKPWKILVAVNLLVLIGLTIVVSECGIGVPMSPDRATPCRSPLPIPPPFVIPMLTSTIAMGECAALLRRE